MTTQTVWPVRTKRVGLPHHGSFEYCTKAKGSVSRTNERGFPSILFSGERDVKKKSSTTDLAWWNCRTSGDGTPLRMPGRQNHGTFKSWSHVVLTSCIDGPIPMQVPTDFLSLARLYRDELRVGCRPSRPELGVSRNISGHAVGLTPNSLAKGSNKIARLPIPVTARPLIAAAPH